jgi:hypothetical protein
MDDLSGGRFADATDIFDFAAASAGLRQRCFYRCKFVYNYARFQNRVKVRN